MLRSPTSLLAALVLGVALYLLAKDGEPSALTAGGEGRVVHIADGDTIDVRLGDGRRERVRYIGIDTPEAYRPGTPVECFARTASKANARLVNGRRVRLVLDREPRDRFGRLLAYVYRVPDGLFVNERLLRGGFARTLSIRPNVRYAARFATIQKEAKRAGRGLWGACPGLADRYG
jgi:micrococcal nuclease